MGYVMKALVFCLAAMLGACATPSPQSGPKLIFVMRHLQAESGSDPGLTAEGQRQAHLVARRFGAADRPRAIYGSRLRRAQESAAPLAAALRISPKIYDPSDTEKLVAQVRSETGNVLVIGHSNTVPDIVERLGGTRPDPLEHHRHGDIWRIGGRPRQTERLDLEPR
jgi:broad specificity phosphatase PhoE